MVCRAGLRQTVEGSHPDDAEQELLAGLVLLADPGQLAWPGPAHQHRGHPASFLSCCLTHRETERDYRLFMRTCYITQKALRWFSLQKPRGATAQALTIMTDFTNK